ncbi:MAG TPA: cupin domain-containing protein [Steroidobacteraceae bacterium]|nr:cupin domain-containing protein [Steroidobacteraceae bacterium]
MRKIPDIESLTPEDESLLGGAVQPAELSAEQRDRMRERILKRVKEPAPENTYTVRAAEGRWIRTSPMSEIKLVRRDWSTNNQSMLVRLAPGAEVITHSHTQEEECVVLEGELEIGEHIFRAGDVHVARPGAAHVGMRTRTGCLLYIRSEIPPDVERCRG